MAPYNEIGVLAASLLCTADGYGTAPTAASPPAVIDAV